MADRVLCACPLADATESRLIQHLLSVGRNPVPHALRPIPHLKPQASSLTPSPLTPHAYRTGRMASIALRQSCSKSVSETPTKRSKRATGGVFAASGWA